jgi:hypothetical protein
VLLHSFSVCVFSDGMLLTPSSSRGVFTVRVQMDGAALRHLLDPFTAQAAVPEQLTAGAAPSSGSLAQVPGCYSTFGTASDLKTMFDKLSTSNAAAMVNFTRATPLGAVTSLSKYPGHGLLPASSNTEQSFGPQFLNKSVNGMGTFTGEGSSNEGTVPVRSDVMRSIADCL